MARVLAPLARSSAALCGETVGTADSSERISEVALATGESDLAEEQLLAEQARLVEAVRTLERARGRLRETAPDVATDAWKAPARARWSLVDEFDWDGRRYVLVYRDAPMTKGPDALTQREREVLLLAVQGHAPKVIAFELGVAPSTVRVHLSNASRKLDVRTLKALIRKYREWLLRQPR